MPRSELYPVKKVIGFERAQLSAIEKWRRRQDPIPSVSAAIRTLVEAGLAAEPRRTKGARKAAGLAGREIDQLGDQSATGEERASRKRN